MLLMLQKRISGEKSKGKYDQTLRFAHCDLRQVTHAKAIGRKNGAKARVMDK